MSTPTKRQMESLIRAREEVLFAAKALYHPEGYICNLEKTEARLIRAVRRLAAAEARVAGVKKGFLPFPPDEVEPFPT